MLRLLITSRTNYFMGFPALSSWSPLGIAMNTKPKQKLTLKLSNGNHGLFGDPELKSFDDFTRLKDRCISDVNALVQEATDKSRTRKLVYIFDDLSDTLCKVADLAEFIRVAHPSPSYVHTSGVASAAVNGLVENLNTNINLYNSLNCEVNNGDQSRMDDMEKHVSQLFLFDFEQSGIHLSETDRYKVVKLNESIMKLGQQFSAGTCKQRHLQQEFVPSKAKYAFKTENDHIVVSNLHPYNDSALVREIAYRVFLYPDVEQEYYLSSLLKLRHDLANVCGFSTYSERTLKGCVLNSPTSVMDFLRILSTSIKPKAAIDFSLMETIKKIEHPVEGQLAPWDVLYYSQKIKNDQFKLNINEYTPYFSLGACVEGLSNLFKHLYGIYLENVEIHPGECWASNVYKLAVNHENEGLLGYIYCDFFERNGKSFHDSHFTIRGAKQQLDGVYQLPIVVIMMNFSSPGWSSPSLLSTSMVSNLFHEMGHAMHSMLGRTQFQHVSGTRCSTDFAEVPSILMEYFASDPRVIKSFARHYRTQAVIPDEILQRLCASKSLFTASEMQLQIFYSILDQIYHGEHPLKGSTTDVLKDTQDFYYNLPHVDQTAWQLRFGHLIGYGAKYYSYLVSKAMASCIWHRLFEEDPFSRSNGEAYRKEILAHGGGKPPYEIIADFLLKEPTPQVLVDNLSKEIETKQALIAPMIKLKPGLHFKSIMNKVT